MTEYQVYAHDENRLIPVGGKIMASSAESALRFLMERDAANPNRQPVEGAFTVVPRANINEFVVQPVTSFSIIRHEDDRGGD